MPAKCAAVLRTCKQTMITAAVITRGHAVSVPEGPSAKIATSCCDSPTMMLLGWKLQSNTCAVERAFLACVGLLRDRSMIDARRCNLAVLRRDLKSCHYEHDASCAIEARSFRD